MADLLIKGMEMPERCIDCPLLLGYHSRLENKTIYHCTGRVPEDSRFAKDVDLSKRPKEGCPLVEVKSHGRLIDADTLADEFFMQLTMTSPYMQRSVVDQMVENVRLASQLAPTVVETSNSDEDYGQMVERDCGGCQKNHNGFCDYFNEPTDDAYLVDCPCKVEASK